MKYSLSPTKIPWAKPEGFPEGQAIFHSISQLAAQYRHSHLPKNGFAAAVAYAAVTAIAATTDLTLAVKFIASVEEVCNGDL